MAQMLARGESDLAIILTEGIVKAIAEGNPSQIVQEYIATPLQWGIHVGGQSPYQEVSDLKGRTAAISRFGSGSHLMAYVNAQERAWRTDMLKFEVVDHLDGAVAALTTGTADYFLWEHFTTKPLVNSGVFRRLGDCPTPWPCFVIAATKTFVDENAGPLRHILDTINLYTSEFKAIPSIDRTLANRYGQKLEDIGAWLALTRWSQDQIAPETIENVEQTLLELKLITQKTGYQKLVTTV